MQPNLRELESTVRVVTESQDKTIWETSGERSDQVKPTGSKDENEGIPNGNPTLQEQQTMSSLQEPRITAVPRESGGGHVARPADPPLPLPNVLYPLLAFLVAALNG